MAVGWTARGHSFIAMLRYTVPVLPEGPFTVTFCSPHKRRGKSAAVKSTVATKTASKRRRTSGSSRQTPGNSVGVCQNHATESILDSSISSAVDMREGPDSFSPIEGGPTQMPTVSVTQAASDTGSFKKVNFETLPSAHDLESSIPWQNEYFSISWLKSSAFCCSVPLNIVQLDLASMAATHQKLQIPTGFVEKNSSGDTWARLKMMPQKGSATIILPSQAQVEAIKKRYLSESGIPRAAAAAAQSMAERGGKLASQRRGGLSMANRRAGWKLQSSVATLASRSLAARSSAGDTASRVPQTTCCKNPCNLGRDPSTLFKTTQSEDNPAPLLLFDRIQRAIFLLQTYHGNYHPIVGKAYLSAGGQYMGLGMVPEARAAFLTAFEILSHIIAPMGQKKKKVPAAITRAFDHIACKLEEIEGSQDKDMRLMSCEKA